MKPETIGQKYDSGKIAPVRCIKNDTLKEIEIQKDCFLLLIIREGTAHFRIGDISFEAIAPCFVCFDERNAPELIRKKGVKCDSVYFHPMFLNVNMTFDLVHGENYENIALTHDLFLMKPFTDPERYTYPIFEESIGTVNQLFGFLEDELKTQSDWYWSCRSRSYFIEIILLLERSYGLIEQNQPEKNVRIFNNPNLENAVIYIENHYEESITLKDICRAASTNHATLTRLFKEELNTTPVEYLWKHRIEVAKKHLNYTNLPIKEIAARCGFKTTQHFVRKFGESVGTTPTDYRDSVVSKRINDLEKGHSKQKG